MQRGLRSPNLRHLWRYSLEPCIRATLLQMTSPLLADERIRKRGWQVIGASEMMRKQARLKNVMHRPHDPLKKSDQLPLEFGEIHVDNHYADFHLSCLDKLLHPREKSLTALFWPFSLLCDKLHLKVSVALCNFYRE